MLLLSGSTSIAVVSALGFNCHSFEWVRNARMSKPSPFVWFLLTVVYWPPLCLARNAATPVLETNYVDPRIRSSSRRSLEARDMRRPLIQNDAQNGSSMAGINGRELGPAIRIKSCMGCLRKGGDMATFKRAEKMLSEMTVDWFLQNR